MNTPTICRPIKGFPGYAICETGEVISFKGKKPRFMKPGRNKCGHAKDYYLCVSLVREDKTVLKTVHSLVAEAFLGPRPEGMVIDHKDGNSFNNHYTNLRYCTQKENLNNPNSKSPGRPGYPIIACKGGVETRFESQAEAAKSLGLHSGTINDCLAGRLRAVRGYTFQRA